MITERRTLLTNGLMGLAAAGAAACATQGAGPVATTQRRNELSIADRIDRLESAKSVDNIMNRYELYLGQGYLEEALEQFALKTLDVKADTGWGIYEGPESIKRLFLGLHKIMIGDRREPSTLKPGSMYVLPNSTATIEVARDGMTAKGLWICTGFSTRVDTNNKADTTPLWAWAKRAADFIREDGEWKIWHYKVYGIFYTPFHKAWTETDNYKNLDFSWVPEHLRPDRPTVQEHTMYSLDLPVAPVPMPPEPYNTFSETFSYM